MFSSQSYEGVLEAARHQNTLLKRALDLRGGDVFVAMDKVQSHDEETQGSGSASAYSDLSALENETDDFGRLLLQHQRDARRLNNAAHGQQAFRKARPHPRIAERLEREELERDGMAGQLHERTGSAGSNDSEPPVTVPREWGRRARKQTDWLRKIAAPSDHGDEASADEIYHRRTSYTGDLNWQAATSAPLQTGEDTPPSMRRGARYTATPSSLRHMNTTLGPFGNAQDENEDDDADFTSNSLMTSTPAQPKYYRKIDELARKEIEDLHTQAVTTRTLDQIDQHAPDATLRRTSNSRLRERAVADSQIPLMVSPKRSAGKSKSPSRIPVRRLNNIGNKENVSVDSEANAGSQDVKKAGQAPSAPRPLTGNKISRPVHQRNDSMSLLRKLARVSSMSPSPQRERGASESSEEKEKHSREGDGDVERPKRTRSADANVDRERLPLIQANSNHRPEQLMANAAIDNADETPMPQEPDLEPQTPVVAGAWVDTTLNLDAEPLPTIDVAEPRPEAGAKAEEVVPVKREHSRPRSALDAIVHEARHHHSDSLQFGESTIQSLEAIAHPIEPTDTSILSDFRGNAGGRQEYEEEYVDYSRPLTQTEKDRRQEDLAMEAMNKHLRTARTNIKDANRGLRRVENRIETVQDRSSSAAPASSTILTTSSRKTIVTLPNNTINKNGTIYCEACGHCQGSVWLALWTEFRSLFYTWHRTGPPKNSWRIRFTGLGLVVLTWWIWYLIESTLCAYHCNPRYADARTWTPIDPFTAPQFPFVIPTLLFRPLKWLWKPILGSAVEAFMVGFVAIFGDGSVGADLPVPLGDMRMPVSAGGAGGFRKEFGDSLGAGIMRSQWVASATATGVRVARSVVDAVDEVGSMWDDEFVP